MQAIERYLISRGYGCPQDKDSGGSEEEEDDDDDMSDEGTDNESGANHNPGGSNTLGMVGDFLSFPSYFGIKIGTSVESKASCFNVSGGRIYFCIKCSQQLLTFH